MLAPAVLTKVLPVLTALVTYGAVSASAETVAGIPYPDWRAFLIFAGYGALGGAAMGMWKPEFRTVFKFMAVLATGAIVSGFVGPAATQWFGPAISPLMAFLASLVAPALILDPIGTVRSVIELGRGSGSSARPSGRYEDDDPDFSGPR